MVAGAGLVLLVQHEEVNLRSGSKDADGRLRKDKKRSQHMHHQNDTKTRSEIIEEHNKKFDQKLADEKDDMEKKQGVRDGSVKTILLKSPTSIDDSKLKKYLNLCDDSCVATTNVNYLDDMSDWDAIVYGENGKDGDFSWRQPHQRFVFYTHKPERTLLTKHHNSFFNWTMTYRRDSDIMNPLGLLHRLESQDDFPVQIPTDDANILAWIQTDCTAQFGLHQELMDKLDAAGVTVSKYGACKGNIPCSVGDDAAKSVDCWTKLKQVPHAHPFLLVIHDAMVRDYVPPAFFQALQHGMIPVVVANVDFLNETHGGIPTKSYVDVLKHGSVQQLATKLLQTARTSKNPAVLLGHYHEWRKHYTISYYPVLQQKALCNLCKLLHHSEEPKVYDDIEAWWQKAQNDNHKTVQLRHMLNALN